MYLIHATAFQKQDPKMETADKSFCYLTHHNGTKDMVSCNTMGFCPVHCNKPWTFLKETHCSCPNHTKEKLNGIKMKSKSF